MLAIANLRWRLLVNSFRGKAGAKEFAGRVVASVFLLCLSPMPILGAGVGAFLLVREGRLARLSWVFWATVLLSQLLNLNIGQPGTNFSPNELIRFPLTLRRFILVRLCFGLLTPANVLAVAMSAAAAVGISLAQRSLLPWAFVALGVFALSNVLLSRMVFAWIDRWMSTRRAREVFTALIFVSSLGFQYMNLRVNPMANGSRHHRHAAQPELPATVPVRVYRRAQPFLFWLPPELTSDSLSAAAAHRTGAFSAKTAAVGLYSVGFLCLFGLRMRTELGGESLSDQAEAGPRTRSAARPAAVPARAAGEAATGARPGAVVRAVLAKEILYTRRNLGIFYSLVAPLVMVLLFAGRISTQSHSPFVMPAAVAYTLLGVMPLSFNSFGLEAAGAQFYFLAPVHVRDVLLAKNVIGFGLAGLEIAAVFLVTTFVAGLPSAPMALAVLCWSAATLLVGTTVGNRRSLAAPKRIALARSSGKQASPLSALISIGILLGFAAVGAAALFAANLWEVPWLPLAICVALLGSALAVYRRGLRQLDAFALRHRETLFAELSKP